ncbi:MAG TPA: efflux RND transporter periplasmic adaptor subunit [Bryobacteraceae bacterium]|nr:efflux RND transporter periplasmic adaptor subunit [Bryobacteraceae bacterium]
MQGNRPRGPPPQPSRLFRSSKGYLKITEPFDGMVTERKAHPGALVGGSSGASLLTVQQITRVRIIAAVPEEDLGGTTNGARVTFTPQTSQKFLAGAKNQRGHHRRRTFVIRNEGGKARWVDIRKVGDNVVRGATDEMRDGIALSAR